jgi:hypothetical protein
VIVFLIKVRLRQLLVNLAALDVGRSTKKQRNAANNKKTIVSNLIRGLLWV